MDRNIHIIGRVLLDFSYSIEEESSGSFQKRWKKHDGCDGNRIEETSALQTQE
jgi:hypothetical protein